MYASRIYPVGPCPSTAPLARSKGIIIGTWLAINVPCTLLWRHACIYIEIVSYTTFTITFSHVRVSLPLPPPYTIPRDNYRQWKPSIHTTGKVEQKCWKSNTRWSEHYFIINIADSIISIGLMVCGLYCDETTVKITVTQILHHWRAPVLSPPPSTPTPTHTSRAIYKYEASNFTLDENHIANLTDLPPPL